ncbi:MAG TPA: zinc ABC transporter substrate-binding protein, partial [Candidatus Saccharimonadales bacterium]
MKDRVNQKYLVAGLVIIVISLALTGIAHIRENPSLDSNVKIQIIAGENFWGSLLSQLGGSKVHVDSIVSDPNADPHEYEVNSLDAREFATANYVVLNGAGYDSWGDKLLSGNLNQNRKVLIVAGLLGKKDGDNPHFWYNPSYVNRVIYQMENDLIALSPSNKSYFQSRYQNLQMSFKTYQNSIASIKKQYQGVKVAATEDIFTYLASATGLNLISPPAFTQAVAEGNDPTTNSIVEFQQQLESGQVKLLVYNQQTVTPLTSNMKILAAEHNIPVIGITETIQPPNTPFQNW